MFLLWIKFIVCSLIVVFSGYKICIYAEKIARITEIGRTFIGLILLAVITSLPELAVTITAVKIGALDLALGDLFGSNLFNLTIMGVIFLFFIKESKLLTFDFTHFVSSGFSLLLIALAAMGIVFYSLFDSWTGYSNILLDVETALILVVYFFGAYLIFRSEKERASSFPEIESREGIRTFGVWLRFLGYAVVLVSFSIYLSKVGDRIARIPIKEVPLGGTFVGSLFIAITTSLPEMVVAVSAVKLGLMDMALGNIFGSNMFNMLIVSVADIFLGKKVILSSVSSLHLLTVFFVIILTALVLAGLICRSQRKMPAFSWDSASIIFIYFVANLTNYLLRGK